MDKNERDTHFQNAAKLLTVQLYKRFGYGIDLRDEDDKEWHILIAQHDYDLAKHIIESLYTRMYNIMGPDRLREFTVESAMLDVPDLIEPPNTSQ